MAVTIFPGKLTKIYQHWVKTINGNRPYNLEDRLDKILKLNITLWSNAKALYMSCDHEYKIKGDLENLKSVQTIKGNRMLQVKYFNNKYNIRMGSKSVSN